MKIKIFPSLIIIILLFTFFVFYKSLQNSNIYVPQTNYKNNIPTFTAKLFDTDDFINSEKIFKKDKFYLMNIWASWCIPCRDEHSFLMNLSNKENIEIVGLNYKDNNKNAKKFLKEFNSPYKIIFSDFDGTIAVEWGAYGVPESFLIYDEKIIKKIIGPLTASSLVEIEKLIK